MYGSWPRGFARYDPVTGKAGISVDVSSDDKFERAHIAGAVTPDGGFAVYATQGDTYDIDLDRSLPLADAVILCRSNLQERRRVTGLLSQAITFDSMAQDRPQVTSLTINGAGNIFLSVLAREDADSRGGIYEFNADGVILRKLDVEMSFWDQLASGPYGSLWYSDPWQGDFKHVTAAGVQRIDLSALATEAETPIGNVVDIATYLNGDVAIVTNSYHMVRISVHSDQCGIV